MPVSKLGNCVNSLFRAGYLADALMLICRYPGGPEWYSRPGSIQTVF